MVIYQDNLEYATEILKALLNELVEKSVLGKHPKLMLRRTESVVEKLLTNWLSLCMYKYLRTLNVFYEGEVTPCKVLNCDTITQAKEKIIDQFYKNIPFSNRPWACDLDLEWKKGGIPVTLQDDDNSTMKWEGWKKINTLQHYRVFDGSECALIRRYQTIKSPNGSLDTSVKHDEIQSKEGGVKMVPEVFLPRLLATKGTLQKFMDDFFHNILSVSSTMPPAIKYLFDYLDNAAIKSNITDSPSNKLLFAKDIPNYRKLVDRFYREVHELPGVAEKEMTSYLTSVSQQNDDVPETNKPIKLAYPGKVYKSSALKELYTYVHKYSNESYTPMSTNTVTSYTFLSTNTVTRYELYTYVHKYSYKLYTYVHKYSNKV
ncbi:PLXA3-like protein [Mya arenaria]|uniref:PLXA3-like protein n=1 Tax=Mya arenaria TaxID=6604 RepID=A0ABY7FXS0_MYAAR|nr:PLXA3-like protein [Mya arenaria]